MSIARRALELAAQGRDVVDLGAGEPAFLSPAVATEAAIEGLRSGFTRYTAVDGLPDLRVALAERYRAQGGPWRGDDDVIVTVGAKAALYQTLQALAEPGDEVIIPSPCWVSLPAQSRLAGARVVLVPLDPEDGFAFDVDRILDALTPRTRVVVVNSPCNPTGAVLARDDLYRLVERCALSDVVVLCDETYERFVYDQAGSVGAAAVASSFPEHLVLVSSFSKAYAMTGWRIGYALGPPALIAALRSLQSHMTSNPTSFAMLGALAALRDPATETEVGGNVDLCAANRASLVPALDALPGARCAWPAGSFYAFMDIRAILGSAFADCVAVSRSLLDQEAVVVVPGAAFGAPGFLRLSYACDAATIAEAITRLGRFFARLQ